MNSDWHERIRIAWRGVRMGFAGFLLAAALHARREIPLVNSTTNGSDNASNLETEQIEIFRWNALPKSITRPAGPFVLMLWNKTGNPKASFFVRGVAPAPESGAIVSATNAGPVLVFGRQAPEVKHRRAAMLNLAKGRYELVSSPDNRVLSTITIE